MFRNFTSHVIKIQSADGFTIEIEPDGIVIDVKTVKNLLGNYFAVPASYDLNGNPCEFPKSDGNVWFVQNKEIQKLMDRNDGAIIIAMGF